MAQNCYDFLTHYHTSQWEHSSHVLNLPSRAEFFVVELPSDAYWWERFPFNQTVFRPVRVHHISQVNQHRMGGVKYPAASPMCGGSIMHDIFMIQCNKPSGNEKDLNGFVHNATLTPTKRCFLSIFLGEQICKDSYAHNCVSLMLKELRYFSASSSLRTDQM